MVSIPALRSPTPLPLDDELAFFVLVNVDIGTAAFVSSAAILSVTERLRTWTLDTTYVNQENRNLPFLPLALIKFARPFIAIA